MLKYFRSNTPTVIHVNIQYIPKYLTFRQVPLQLNTQNYFLLSEHNWNIIESIKLRAFMV